MPKPLFSPRELKCIEHIEEKHPELLEDKVMYILSKRIVSAKDTVNVDFNSMVLDILGAIEIFNPDASSRDRLGLFAESLRTHFGSDVGTFEQPQTAEEQHIAMFATGLAQVALDVDISVSGCDASDLL